MVRRLAKESPHTLTTISQGLNITRQGARKHLQVLVESKIISLEPKGRETIIQLNKNTLTKGRSFITELEQQWDNRLLALKKFVEN
jgi:predicted ArsR family transcriptional regulator